MINVLERITSLRERSGLTQSTISSWYRKDILPTIPSLERICIAFGISLSQFFKEETDEVVLINPNQKKLLEVVSKLDDKQYNALLHFLENIT